MLSAPAWRADGFSTFPYDKAQDRFRAETGSDGRAQLHRLCKGVYTLKIEALGKAWTYRKAILAPTLDPVSVEIVMDQAESISGQVRDESGLPVAEATVLPNWCEHIERGEFGLSTMSGHDPVITDAGGRFHINRLQAGQYVFGVKKLGFQPIKPEVSPKVPPGTENVTIILKRSRPS